MNIYVGNISHSSTEDGLKQLFGQFGTVTSARIMTDRFTGKSRGFAFVDMANQDEAQQAIDNLNGTEFDGRTIRVSQAMERTERPNRPFNRGGGDRGGFHRGGGDYGNRDRF